MTSAPYRPIVAVAAAALLLAGCGDDDSAPPDGDANTPPEISGEPPDVVQQGESYSFTPDASDADGDALIFGIDGKPGWMQFDTGTGRLSGVPAGTHVGIYRGIVVWVSDGESETLLDAFDLTVEPLEDTGNAAPEIAGEPATAVTAGEPYRFVPEASDPDGDPLSFTIQNRPAWAEFDTATGRLEGVPADADVGMHESIVIGVRDALSISTLPPFEIEVTAEDANTAPSISGQPPERVESGSAYTFTPTGSDADGDPLSFSIENAPPWAGFDASSGRLQGTPDDGDIGVYENIVVSVSDGVLGDSLPPFTIEVAAPSGNTAPTLSGTPEGTATAGEPYAFQPTADDPDGDPLTFSIANQPSWASFSETTGSLAGTPDNADAGAYDDIVIGVSDGHAVVEMPAFSITVAAVNTAPTISGDPPTEVLQDDEYRFEPSASDADGDPLSFSIENAPPWAGFDSDTGQLSGTPGAGDVGTYTGIVISVSDGDESAALSAFDITVEAVALGTATLTWTAPTERTDGSALTDLAGFKVYWGTSSGNYSNSTTISNPTVTSHVVENLVSGTWYFATTAYDGSGLESTYSNEATKTIE